MEDRDTGILLQSKNIKLQRNYFKEMTRLIGINVLFRSPKDSSKTYDLYGELDTFYNAPVKVGCVFEEYPKQSTMKKLGWNSELSEELSLIHVPYDLEGLQVGSLFIVPSGIDGAEGRVFKVIKMSTIAIFPSSVTCEIGPMFVNDTPPAAVKDFRQNNFNLLRDNEEDD